VTEQHANSTSARPAAATIRELTPAEAATVPALWASAWGQVTLYPLEERVWRERLALHHQPDLLIGAFEADELVGVAYGRLPTAAWQPQDVGWVTLLAVAATRQGRGIGTRLLAELLARLRAAGATRFKLGSDANHLLPGPPQESSAALWLLARRAGARFTAAEHDLHIDLRRPLPPAPLAPGWRVRSDDPDGAMRFVARTFPGRWTHELEAYIAAGSTVLTIAREADTAAGDSAEAYGFCAVFQGEEAFLGPSLYWRSALTSDVGPVRVAGMGPLGVSGEVRGAGLGLAIVRAGAQWLQERGATDLLINWTTLTTFYGKLGARVWRTYQRTEGEL